jgi:hypothetical protein
MFEASYFRRSYQSSKVSSMSCQISTDRARSSEKAVQCIFATIFVAAYIDDGVVRVILCLLLHSSQPFMAGLEGEREGGGRREGEREKGRDR